jgi:hypothetical protein
MSRCIYVIDASYLVEYYKVGKHWSKKNFEEISKRIEEAVITDCDLYVPIPVIYETANHIAGVKDGNHRRKIAKLFCDNIQTSCTDDSPFFIIPYKEFESIQILTANLLAFSEENIQRKISLTDTTVIHFANKLKQECRISLPVHIWTMDEEMKSQEPDKEENSFIGVKKKLL